MRPLQVWLPRLRGSLATPETRRDRERAFCAWQGEGLVWIIPGWAETMRWQEPDGTRALALRGEQWERVHVYHVGESGAVSGPDAGTIFPNGSINGLLKAWLNLPAGAINFVPGRDELRVSVPDYQDGHVVYRSIRLPLEPGSFLPITSMDEATRTVRLRWPPEPTAPPPVSPEAESADRYRFVPSASLRTGAAEPRAAEPVLRALPMNIEWPAPFTELFPVLPSLDEMYARDRMVAVAERSRRDLHGARGEARNVSDAWLSEGQSTLLHGWFEPIIAAEGEEGAMLAAEARYNLSAGSLEQGLSSSTWRDVLDRPMPIGRVWGVPGLCWALLMDHLECGISFRNCGRCGRLIHGRSHKRFCARDDDVECFRQRRAENRREERRRRGTQ